MHDWKKGYWLINCCQRIMIGRTQDRKSYLIMVEEMGLSMITVGIVLRTFLCWKVMGGMMMIFARKILREHRMEQPSMFVGLASMRMIGFWVDMD
ncbi:MAG: hypothetical protein NPIRA04_01470 [Nitrospirales bacterium]|nr:MAG: hypothetical protein NPIRA04_01470 [Nitrospirales bacterium]